jgi:hypothetical protein
MKTLCCFSLFVVLLTGWFSAPVAAQTATVISDTETAQHVGQKVTVVTEIYRTGLYPGISYLHSPQEKLLQEKRAPGSSKGFETF